MTTDQLLSDFKSQFPEKYTFISKTPIGKGHYAAVFKAEDMVRGLDVGIKIFHDGIAPDGSKRGWWISSQLSHNQIATTYTVEDFFTVDGTPCKAVISKFIPGSSLKKVWNTLNDLSDLQRPLIADDFALSFIPSLLLILDEIHKAGYGHGDLHDGNIMVVPTTLGTDNQFLAVLIDFDNASIKQALAAKTEQDKIKTDYSLLKRILNYTLMDWEWHKIVLSLHDGYDTVPAFKVAYEMVLNFLSMAKKNELTAYTLEKFFVNLINFGLFSVPPIIDAARVISIKYNMEHTFEAALQIFNQRMKRPENWDADVTMEIFHDVEIKMDAYRKIFKD